MTSAARFVTAALLGMLSLTGCAPAAQPIRPEASIDLPQYMGRWYVIASIPTPLERDGFNTTETYSFNPDGTVCAAVSVRPERFSPEREFGSTARVIPGRGNAEWQASLPYLYNPEYLVGWVKPDYSQALVVRNRRDYLWFMARTPQVSEADYRAMLARARAMGYRTDRIRMVPQEWPDRDDEGRASLSGACA